MSSEQYREQGIEAAKARRMDEARQLLQQALRLNPRDAVAWLYLASTTQDKKERLLYLQKVLEIDPQNDLARKAVEAMGISVEQLLKAKPGAAATPTESVKPPTSPAKPLTSVKPPAPPAPTPPSAPIVPDYLADLDTDEDAVEAEADDIPDYLRDLAEEYEEEPDDFAVQYPMFGDDEDEEEPFAPATGSTGTSTLSGGSSRTADTGDLRSAFADSEFRDSDLDDDDEFPEFEADEAFEDPDDRPTVRGSSVIANLPLAPGVTRTAGSAGSAGAAGSSAGEYRAGARSEPRMETPSSTSAIPAPSAEPARPMPVPPPSNVMEPGVPLPDANYLEQVLLYLEPITQAYLAPVTDDVEWTRKEKNRAGERDIWTLRLQVGAAVLGTLFVIGIIGLLVVYNVPEVRRIVFVATRTPTLTPSVTPTATPGFTPTASATLDTTKFPTYTPSATIPLTLTPVARINITPRPTALDLPVNAERGVLDSVRLIEEAQYDVAIPTLQAEVRLSGSIFNPNPYYFEAVALARAGDARQALQVMQDAETELEKQSSRDITLYTPLVNTGFAEVLVQAAADTGSTQGLTEARQRLEDALALNPRLARAQVLLGETYRLSGDYAGAIRVLDTALQVPELASDLTLILEKGRVYISAGNESLRRGSTEEARAQFEQADYQAYYALYLNPYSEEAHQLRIQSALARSQPGLAVLYTQTYLLYYPDSPAALRYMGDARQAEGNADLALVAYSQALNSGQDSPLLLEPLLARAAFYESNRREDLAMADYERALVIDPQPAIRARRMLSAYRSGDLDTAARDADALLGSGALPDDQIKLLQGRIMIDRAPRNAESVYQDAVALLNQVNDAALTPEDAGILNQYRAQANLLLGNLDEARLNIDAALMTGETGTRHYLSGQIYEAQGNFAAAARDYEWIATWNTVFGYDFADDAAGRLADVRQQATEAAEATMTAEAAGTPTPTPKS